MANETLQQLKIKPLPKAQEQFNFYETPREHAVKIYNDYNPSSIVDVIDICCGLGSLVQPAYCHYRRSSRS
jgi:predicted RNA methylase